MCRCYTGHYRVGAFTPHYVLKGRLRRCQTPTKLSPVHLFVIDRKATAGSTNMASNKKGNAPRDDQFAFMEQSNNTAANPPRDNIYHVTDQTLANHDVYPNHMPKRLKDRNNENSIQIRYKETQEHNGRVFFENFERWYTKHQMEALSATDADVTMWKKMLYEDPLGINGVPNTNTRCWKHTRVGREDVWKKTSFLISLENFQEENYLFYRASVHRFLCDDSVGRLNTWVTQQEQNHTPPLDKSNRLNKDVRLTWQSMKEFCLQLCIPTLGSYYFLTLFKLHRKQEEGFHAWADNISRVNAAIRRHGNNWDKVCDRESMHVLKNNLSNKERVAILEHLHTTDSNRQAYPTIDDVANKMDVATFMQKTQDIPRERLPTTFPAAAQREALKKTLVLYEEVADLKRKNANLVNQNKQLQEQLDRAKNDKQHQRRKNKVLEDEKAARKHDDKHNADVPIGNHGKAKAGHCQLCKNAGLGNRRHKGACDPNRRADAVAKLAKKKQKGKGKGKGSKPRRNPLSSYKEGACKVCIEEDVNPQFCNHPSETCWRRKGGELDQKGIKEPKKRNMTVAKMCKDAKAKKAKAAKAEKAKTAKRSKRTGTSRVSRQVGSESPAEYDEDEPPHKRRTVKKDKNRKPDGVPDHLWVPTTKNCRGYVKSLVAYKNPLTEKELDYLFGPDARQRDNAGLIEMKRCFWEKKDSQRALVRFREEAVRREADKRKALQKKRTEEPQNWKFRKSTAHCHGYWVSDEAIANPLTSLELDAMMDSKSRNTPKAIEETIKRYEERNFTAKERLRELRDHQIASEIDRESAVANGHYKPSAPTYVHPKAKPIAKTYGERLLAIRNDDDQETLLKCRITDIAKALRLRSPELGIGDAAVQAQDIAEVLERPKSNTEIADRIVKIGWLNLPEAKAELLKHKLALSNGMLTRCKSLEIQGRIRRFEDHIARMNAEGTTKAVTAVRVSRPEKREREEDQPDFDPVATLVMPRTPYMYNKAVKAFNKWSTYVTGFNTEGSASKTFLSVQAEKGKKFRLYKRHKEAFLEVKEEIRKGIREHNIREAKRKKAALAQRAVERETEPEVTKEFLEMEAGEDDESGAENSSPAYQPTPVPSSGPESEDEYQVSPSSSPVETDYEVTTHNPMMSSPTVNGSCAPLGRNERLEWHQPPKRTAYEGRVHRRGAFYQELYTDVLDLPNELWCPASVLPRPIARTRIRITKLSKKNKSSKRLMSETKGERLLQTYVQYRAPDGTIKRGRVEIDTMSNVNYTAPGVSLPRKRRPYEATKVKGISNQTVRLGKPTAFTIMRHGKAVVIDSVKAPRGMFDDGCIALLGLDAIATLGVDVNALISSVKHTDIKYLTDTDEVIKRAKADAIERFPLQKQFERYTYKRTFLSERICAAYLKQHPDDYKSVEILRNDIDIAPHMPAEARARILQLLHQYGGVFANKTNSLPKPMKGVPPHIFKLKENAVPSRTGRPKFGPAQAKIITQWVEWASSKEIGLIEPANSTSWSSRLILAPKYKANTPKSSLPDGIRVAWAGVQANEQIEKTIPTYPDAWEELYKVANYKYKFSADGLKQYWSIPLDPKSREVTAFWTPQGLFQFTRLVMGTKNAATVAQNAYTHALHTMLDKESFTHIANFADDFLGGADTVDSLLDHFENFLKMCDKAGITLNPQKIRIGYECEQFYGLSINKGRIEPATRNLDPIKKMTPPKTRSELRSIMGVFNQFSNFIDNYARGKKPAAILNSLISPKVTWDFTEKHVKALEDLKRVVLEGDVHLYAPNHDIPLRLETDASDDGWGAVLYQIVDGEKRTIKMWSKQWKTEAWLRKPPYHREAKAWMNGLTLTIPFALYNKHPVHCYTDHTPLTWIKHTSGKGPVSQFIVDNLSVIDYVMHYLEGPENVVADSLSRFPMIGPSELRREGVSEALNILLAAITGTNVDTDKIWFYAGKDTRHLVSNLYDWRDNIRKEYPPSVVRKPRCYMDLFSTSNINKVEYTLGIWTPPADKVTDQCRMAFRKGKPFACLVPSDLVQHIARDGSKQIIGPVQQQVDDAMKIAFLSPALTWVIHGLDFSKKERIRTVYANRQVTPDIDLEELMKHLKDSNMTPPLPEFASREDWIKAQEKERCALIWESEPGVHKAADGLIVLEMPKGSPLRTIVPTALHIPLATWQHRNLCHVGYQKVLSILKKKFFWKNMRRTCKHVVSDCALCNLLKARMKLAHKHFRAKLFCTPRTAYGADYYAVKQNKEGYCQILGMVDLAIGYLSLSALKARTAANTAHELFYEIIVRKGVPRLFHSDAAKEFLSVAMKALSATLGIVQTNTLAHNPKSNAKMERIWQYVGRCLQSMTPEQYARFHKYVPIMAHVWNTVPDSDTGITPFEAQHGMKCRSVLDCVLENPPKEGLPASADDIRAIATSVSAFVEAIRNVKAVEKSLTAMRLNEDGTSKIEYNLHDKVSFYLPPNEKTAQQMNKKKKHILRYGGPGELVESLSPNGTSWRILYKGRHYDRSVMHLRPYTARDEVPAALQIAHDDTVWVGSYVAVLDGDEETHYHLGQVVNITDQLTTIHYMGTKSRQLRSAVWKKLYHHPGTRLVVSEQPQNLIRNWMRFTGEVDTRPREDSLIILSNIGFTDTGRVNRTSRDMLNRLPFRHHVMTRTWNP